MPHARPAKGEEVLCTTCVPPNRGKRTATFNDPLIRYVGRYVDSSTTPNVQNLGMRTVRAQRIRVSHPLKRIFVKYAETIAGFSFDQFLANVAVPDLPKVGVMKTGNASPSRPRGTEVELVARPNTFFYAEAAASGWEVQRLDTQEVLTDFDVDDVGFVYVGTLSFGWGISKDETNESQIPLHMTTRVQLKDAPITPHSVLFMKVGAVPFAVISANVVSANASSMLIYDTSDRARPVLKQTRKGKPNSIAVWARFEPGKRLAAVTADGKLRIHAYDTFVTGGAPLVEVAPTGPGKTFRDLSFDENGTLWAVESAGTSAVAGNKLWQFNPTAAGYTQKQHDVFGGPFAPQQLAARKGYVVVGGNAAGSKTELRLYRTTAGAPQFVDTGNFFFRFYHDKTPPDGFASASTYGVSTTSLKALHILDHKGKVYLLYSADGLGDVYELQAV